MTAQRRAAQVRHGAIDESKVEEFAEKVGADQAVGEAAVLAYIGDRLGLWAAMASAGPVTPDELAETTGLHSRYLAEWLAAQAAVGYIVYDPESDRFTLPPEHAAVLADDDSLAALAGGFEFQAGCWADADRIVETFRSGDGLLWGEHDQRLLNGVARFFRPLYAASLVQGWLPALDGVVSKLERGGRVLDIGCGYGTTTILMAQAFPPSTFRGVDPHEGSVERARTEAGQAGVGDRVAFELARAEDDHGQGWDLISFFDAFHHLGDPEGVARHLRRALAADGTLMLVEPLARDRIEDNLTLAGPVYYSPSTLICVPDALAQPGGAALGAQAGPDRLKALLEAAGFTTVRVAQETDFNLVIEARS